MSEIHDRITALEAQLAELKNEVREPTEVVEPTSRRDVFKKLALGAAGVAAGGALLGKATPAMAADGQAILMGTEAGQNVATLPTRLNATGAGRVGLVVQSGTSYASGSSNVLTALAGWASATGTADAGVYGYSERGTAVGVVGWSETVATGIGVIGRASGTQSVGGQFLGGRAALNVVSNGAATNALVAAVKKGDILATNDGTLWFAPADGDVVPLGGAAAGNALYLLDAPARAYDSRTGTTAPFGPLNGAGSPRTISLATGTAAGATVDAVPAGATGALVSVTLDATVGSGFLALFAADIAYPGKLERELVHRRPDPGRHDCDQSRCDREDQAAGRRRRLDADHRRRHRLLRLRFCFPSTPHPRGVA